MAWKTAGGYVKNCDSLLEAVTPSGRLKNFRTCADYINSNKWVKKEYAGINCYNIFLEKK